VMVERELLVGRRTAREQVRMLAKAAALRN
jgi:hypothetical protein